MKFKTIISIVIFSSCTTPGYHRAYTNLPTPTPEPAPKPPEPPKPEFTKCRVSNGAGRIFQVIHPDAYLAESNARRECLRTARTCVLLGCAATLEQP